MIKAILTASICLSVAATSTAAEVPQIKTLEIGSQAPDFSLQGTDGKTYTLNTFKKAKYLVAVFTCNHCPDAIAARDKINQFSVDYKSKGVEVVAISSASPKGLQLWENGHSKYSDDFESMKLVAKKHKLTHPYLYDGDTQKTSIAYGAVATPHVFIFGPDRKLLYQGQFDNGQRNPGPAKKKPAINAIDALLAGKPVTETKTRVFGCSTKWHWKDKLVAAEKKEWESRPVSVDAMDATLAKNIAANNTQKYRLVNIWSTSCGPCIQEFPTLVRAYQFYTQRPFELITISTDPKADNAKVLKFLKDQHLPVSKWTQKSVNKEGRKTNNYHFQGDDLDDLAKAIDPKWQGPLPHSFIIAPGGEVVWRKTGAVEIYELRSAILDAINGKKPTQ